MQGPHKTCEIGSIPIRSIPYFTPLMKDLSKVDMSDLAKEWESRMNGRNQAQLHNYSLLYGSAASEPEQVEGVKTSEAKLNPRPEWNAP